METRTCHDCLYAHWDKARWLWTLQTGRPCGPTCINHPDSPGEPREILKGGDVCRNFRPRLPQAGPEGASPASAPPGVELRRIPLTRDKFAIVTAGDYEWLSRHRWSCRGGGNPYAARFENGRVVWMHREIMHTPPDKVCDHIDGNGLNNVPWNLRNCDHKDNVHNLSKAAHGTSIYKGVYRDKHTGKYCAKICEGAKRHWLGTHVDEADAARAYDLRAVQLFGDYARVNFPDDWPPERRRQVHAEYRGAEQGEGEKVGRCEGRSSRGESSFARKAAEEKGKANSNSRKKRKEPKNRSSHKGTKPRRNTEKPSGQTSRTS